MNHKDNTFTMNEQLTLLTSRFNEACAVLQQQKTAIKLDRRNLYRVKTGQKTASLLQILTLINEHNISAEWLFCGKLPIINPNKEKPAESK